MTSEYVLAMCVVFYTNFNRSMNLTKLEVSKHGKSRTERISKAFGNEASRVRVGSVQSPLAQSNQQADISAPTSLIFYSERSFSVSSVGTLMSLSRLRGAANYLFRTVSPLETMISIIGAGKVGSAAAFNILRFRISDVVLIDVVENMAHGEALDMMQAAPAIEFDGKIEGTNDFSKMKGSELVIITAGEARKPGTTRLDLMNKNAVIIKSIVKEVVRYAPGCKLMIVTNPVDIMTYVAYKESGFERNRVFGMGNILDTLRFRSYISMELNVSREDTRALVIGEHGDSMVPLVDHASVSGVAITDLLSKEQVERIVDQTRTSGADVIKLKGSTTYGPAAVIAIMADAVLRGRNRVMSVSTYLKGEYGFSDVSIGVPVVLGRNGVERILELRLTPETKQLFEKSVSIIREATEKLQEHRLKNASLS